MPQTTLSAVCYDIESAVQRNRVRQKIPDWAIENGNHEQSGSENVGPAVIHEVPEDAIILYN